MLVPEALAAIEGGPTARIVVRDPYAALVQGDRGALPGPLKSPAGVDPTARIGAGCVIGEGVTIGPFAVLGRDVRLGDRCRLAEGVSLGDGVEVGDDSVLGPHVVCYRESRIGAG